MKKLLLPIILFLAFSAVAQSLLTNQAIIEMAKAEISDAVIIAKIKAFDGTFDTSTEALKLLKENKVSDAVQTAMIEKSTETKPLAFITGTPSKFTIEDSTPSPLFTPYSQLSKQAQKERLKQLAQIQIKAPKETVASVLIQTVQNMGFILQNESPNRLMLQKALSGGNAILGQLAVGTRGGSYPLGTYTFSLNTVGAITTVVADISIVSENVFGKSNRLDLNKNKKNRAEMDEVLLYVKKQCEK